MSLVNRVIDGIDENPPLALIKVLSTLPSHSLIISIAADGLLTTRTTSTYTERRVSSDTFS